MRSSQCTRLSLSPSIRFSSSRTSVEISPSEVTKFRTAGKSGSADYIPYKRGYAPNIPIPAHKFNLPVPKKVKLPPSPEKTAPRPKPENVPGKRSVEQEYKRQWREMRRGYVYWRHNNVQERWKKREEIRNRVPVELKSEYQPPFAEAMSRPSESDQQTLEKKLFSVKFEKRERGAGFRAERHQRLLDRQWKSLINNYLELYHASETFITNSDELEDSIKRAFPDFASYTVPFRPQSLKGMLRDMEDDHGYNSGYAANMRREKIQAIMNKLFG